MFNFGDEKNYLAGVHVDEVGSFLPQRESVKSIFGIYQVILSTLLDPENISSEVVSVVTKTKKKNKDKDKAYLMSCWLSSSSPQFSPLYFPVLTLPPPPDKKVGWSTRVCEYQASKDYGHWSGQTYLH